LLVVGAAGLAAGAATAGIDGTGALAALAAAGKLNSDASAKRKTVRQSFVIEILQVDLRGDQNLAQIQTPRSNSELRAT
jgi:hypothetical protein